MQVQRVTRDGLARIRAGVAAVAEAEGLTAHRRAVEIRFEGGRPDVAERTPEALAAVSHVYTWEPPDRVIAARYGLRARGHPALRPQHLAAPPRLLAEVLAGPFDPPLNEYPDSIYADLAEAAADYVGATRSEILVGAGADEVLDIIAKTFLAARRPGRRAHARRTRCTGC